jgi:hypothetical protein
MCHSSFQHPQDRPDFRRTDWAKFQTYLETKVPFNPDLHTGMAINTFVENLSEAVIRALGASTPRSRSRDDPRPPIPAGIQEGIHVNNRLPRRWQITRDPALKAEVNRLQMSVTNRLNEWRNDQRGATLETLNTEDQSLWTLWRITKRVTKVPTRSPLWSLPENRSFQH